VPPPRGALASIGVFCSGGLQRRAATTASGPGGCVGMTAPLPPVGLRLMLRIRTPPHRSPQFTAAASHYRFASVRPSVVSFAFHNTVSPNKPNVDACRLLAAVLFLCASETQSLDWRPPAPAQREAHRTARGQSTPGRPSQSPSPSRVVRVVGAHLNGRLSVCRLLRLS
jgi:hypothetical protein